MTKRIYFELFENMRRDLRDYKVVSYAHYAQPIYRLGRSLGLTNGEILTFMMEWYRQGRIVIGKLIIPFPEYRKIRPSHLSDERVGTNFRVSRSTYALIKLYSRRHNCPVWETVAYMYEEFLYYFREFDRAQIMCYMEALSNPVDPDK